MNLATAIASYKEVKVTEVSDEESPHELIRIVFQVLQENLDILKKNVKYTDDRWQKPFNKCMFALSILRESLDFEKGGEVADSLDALYAFAQKTMLKAVGKSSSENLEIVFTIIQDISSAWDEIKPPNQ
ncbi:MAG: flagellar protein FliS [Pseudomonadota bacterium]|nr:flagellar protein FliS [Pseudomonadota bacterium]